MNQEALGEVSEDHAPLLCRLELVVHLCTIENGARRASASLLILQTQAAQHQQTLQMQRDLLACCSVSFSCMLSGCGLHVGLFSLIPHRAPFFGFLCLSMLQATQVQRESAECFAAES